MLSEAISGLYEIDQNANCVRSLDTIAKHGESTVRAGAGTPFLYKYRLSAKGAQMLAELKDLVQKSLFTKVRGLMLHYSSGSCNLHLVRGQADREKTDAVRNCTRPSHPKEERLPAIRSI